jgi:hypothetical protein
MTSLISATAGIPGAERYVGPLYETLMAQRNREAAANVPLTGQTPQQPQQSFQGGQIGAQGNAPSDQVSKFFPKNIGPNEAPGNLPQEATGGQIKPIWSGEEVLQQGEGLYKKWIGEGRTDRTLEQAIDIKRTENEENKAYNQNIETERQKRIAEQEAFGEIAETALVDQFKNATAEQKAIFRKKGEDVAGRGKSQAEIKRTLTKDAVKFADDYSNAQRQLQAPRIQNKISRLAEGKTSDLKQAESDAKSLVQPFINLGLYDTSRDLLAGGGFYPEERERIIFGEIPPGTKNIVNSIPKPTYNKSNAAAAVAGVKNYNPNTERTYSEKSLEDLKSNIKSVWGGEKENPSINPILLRKQYEDQGYDWRAFKDAMNSLVMDEKIILNPDQNNLYNDYLNEPPLSNLNKILYKLNIVGR